jgi:hypothetical protein
MSPGPPGRKARTRRQGQGIKTGRAGVAWELQGPYMVARAGEEEA